MVNLNYFRTPSIYDVDDDDTLPPKLAPMTAGWVYQTLIQWFLHLCLLLRMPPPSSNQNLMSVTRPIAQCLTDVMITVVLISPVFAYA